MKPLLSLKQPSKFSFNKPLIFTRVCMIVYDGGNARCRLTTNYHALSSTIPRYHSL